MLTWSRKLKIMPLSAGSLAICFAAFGQSNQSLAKPAQVGPAASAPAPAGVPKTSASTAAPLVLTAKQIVDRNVAARGGLAAWRAVDSMIESGKIEDSGNVVAQQPFVLTMKRPRKSRLELTFQDQILVQAYDGKYGWKLQPWHSKPQAYTPAELEKAADQMDLDGPLIDYAVKGTKVEYEGIEQVEGRDAYKLKLTLMDSHVRRIWIDTRSFLEVKIEAAPRVVYGRQRQVTTTYRDYRSVNGLMIPYVLETTVEGVNQTHKVKVEKVVLNAIVDARAFAPPGRVTPAVAMKRGSSSATFGAPPVRR